MLFLSLPVLTKQKKNEHSYYIGVRNRHLIRCLSIARLGNNAKVNYDRPHALTLLAY